MGKIKIAMAAFVVGATGWVAAGGIGVAHADPTCATPDSSLPAPVLGTALGGVGTAQQTAQSTSGQTAPADIAGTIGTSAGCTTATSNSGSTDPSVDSTSATGSATGGGPASAVAADAATPSGQLPSTGTSPLLAASGVALLGMGLVLRRLSTEV